MWPIVASLELNCNPFGIRFRNELLEATGASSAQASAQRCAAAASVREPRGSAVGAAPPWGRTHQAGCAFCAPRTRSTAALLRRPSACRMGVAEARCGRMRRSEQPAARVVGVAGAPRLIWPSDALSAAATGAHSAPACLSRLVRCAAGCARVRRLSCEVGSVGASKRARCRVTRPHPLPAPPRAAAAAADARRPSAVEEETRLFGHARGVITFTPRLLGATLRPATSRRRAPRC